MTTTESTSQGIQQVLCFALAGEAFGLPILKVREIQAQATITRMPQAPVHMPGVINLRGAIVPIIELRQRFSLGEAPDDARPVIIVVEVQNRTLGIRVDSVSDVIDLDSTSIRSAPEMGNQPALGRKFISGLASLPGSTGDEAMLILLDLDQLLSDSELEAIDSAPQTRPC